MFCLELHMAFDMRTQVHTRKSPSWDYIFQLQEIWQDAQEFAREFWQICIWKVNKAVDRELVFHVANESHSSLRPPEEHYRRSGSKVTPATPPKYFSMAAGAIITLYEESLSIRIRSMIDGKYWNMPFAFLWPSFESFLQRPCFSVTNVDLFWW